MDEDRRQDLFKSVFSQYLYAQGETPYGSLYGALHLWPRQIALCDWQNGGNAQCSLAEAKARYYRWSSSGSCVFLTLPCYAAYPCVELRKCVTVITPTAESTKDAVPEAITKTQTWVPRWDLIMYALVRLRYLFLE